jgi:hypothetical protein
MLDTGAHLAKFEADPKEKDFNRKQVFAVMTNGVDYQTREAIQYWRSRGLDVRQWLYRVYSSLPDEMLLEISAFRVGDNPHEDLSGGYYILNTNSGNDQRDHGGARPTPLGITERRNSKPRSFVTTARFGTPSMAYLDGALIAESVTRFRF